MMSLPPVGQNYLMSESSYVLPACEQLLKSLYQGEIDREAVRDDLCTILQIDLSRLEQFANAYLDLKKKRMDCEVRRARVAKSLNELQENAAILKHRSEYLKEEGYHLLSRLQRAKGAHPILEGELELSEKKIRELEDPDEGIDSFYREAAPVFSKLKKLIEDERAAQVKCREQIAALADHFFSSIGKKNQQQSALEIIEILWDLDAEDVSTF